MGSRTRNLERLGDRFTVSIPASPDGLTGRECPVEHCEGFFRIEFGTGLKGEELPCHCPYCGHQAGHSEFYTREQIEYAQSVAINRITGAVLKDLKALEFDHRPRPGTFGIGISMKVTGRPYPIRYYREKALETEVVCDQCTLRYAIYGVFAFCPDCGVHNSRQILERNLTLAVKQLALAAEKGGDLEDYLVREALGGVVASFDGFGREIFRIHACRATNPQRAAGLSFQNLPNANTATQQLFGIDLAVALAADEWAFACRAFQKRHLVAHKMGVVDAAYLAVTADPAAALGRKIPVAAAEVEQLIQILGKLSAHLVTQLTPP